MESAEVVPLIDETPEALIAAIAAHQDRPAFVRLFHSLGPRLKAYMKRLGADDALADDLIQDVMLSVWRRAKQFDPERASAVTWVFAIARNRRIDLVRRDRRIEHDTGEMPDVADEGQDGFDALSARETGQRIRAAMKGLSQDQVAVVRLSFFEDKSHAVIAEELGVPLGTVKSRIRLAMDKMRLVLGEET